MQMWSALMVTLQLMLLAALAPAGWAAKSRVAPEYRINLEVFYRAFCPACQWFVGDPLLKLINDEQIRNIVDLTLYPAAGMIIEKGVLDCEGGNYECWGHRWQVCVIEKDRDDVVKYLTNVACVEGDASGDVGEWDAKIKYCFSEQERVALKECYDTRSEELLRAMIVDHYADKVEWMPFTVMNRQVIGTATTGVGLKELRTSICSAYKGPKKFYPDICTTVVGEQKEFVPDPEPVEPAVEVVTAQPEPPAMATPATVVVVEATPKPAAAADKAEVAPEEKEEPLPEGVIELDIKEEEDIDTNNKVRLDLFWRAFCPGCMGFITSPLVKLLRNEEFRSIVDFHPVPAAGMYYDADGEFVCSMGPIECTGHRWLSCAINEFPAVDDMIERLACMEGKDNRGMTWTAIIKKCFPIKDHFTKMKSCFDTKSKDLLAGHVATRKTVKIQWVPFVMINNELLGNAHKGIGYDFLQEAICKGYTGSPDFLPSACQPKRLRQSDVAPDETEETIIKPCPPKKEAAAAAAEAAAVGAEFKNQDAPGAGFQRPPAADTAGANEAAHEGRELEGGQKGAAVAVPAKEIATEESFNFQSLLFPLGCFVVLGFIARTFSGDHKKDA